VRVCLISTYELGRQPFAVASAARWLADAGAEVTCIDLSIDRLDELAVRQARLIAIYLPMHTATRLAVSILPKIKEMSNSAHLAFYGLYATANKVLLRELGGETVLSGEVEPCLVRLYRQLEHGDSIALGDEVHLAKQRFRLPKRDGLPELGRYATLDMRNGQQRIVGYTEATRGCKHVCRHCPVVPVYQGRFFVVDRDVVLADVRQQVSAGAGHVTFGDPDFFNGPGHAMRLVEAFHGEFPELSYDVTIKVEHLLTHRDKLHRLVESGCLFVTTAVEEIDDAVLARLEKGHTRCDFVEVIEATRSAGLTLSPTFIPFHPWTTASGFLDLLNFVAEHGLIDNVAPVQLSIRLLVPEGSRIMELDEMAIYLDDFDAEKLSYAWTPADPTADRLQARVREAVQTGDREGMERREVFRALWEIAHESAGVMAPPLPTAGAHAHPVPVVSEPWYCCAEPTEDQLAQA